MRRLLRFGKRGNPCSRGNKVTVQRQLCCFVSVPFGDCALHLRLDLLQQLRQLTLICVLRVPLDAQSLLLVRLRDQVEMYMIDLLVCNSSIVLQNIVVLDSLCDCNPLGYRQHFRELFVGDIV
jgi:hypothetical protein